jgi:hypothetical protein
VVRGIGLRAPGHAVNDGLAAASTIELHELVEHWPVLDDERALAGTKRGATRLGLLLLKFYSDPSGAVAPT